MPITSSSVSSVLQIHPQDSVNNPAVVQAPSKPEQSVQTSAPPLASPGRAGQPSAAPSSSSAVPSPPLNPVAQTSAAPPLPVVSWMLSLFVFRINRILKCFSSLNTSHRCYCMQIPAAMSHAPGSNSQPSSSYATSASSTTSAAHAYSTAQTGTKPAVSSYDAVSGYHTVGTAAPASAYSVPGAAVRVQLTQVVFLCLHTDGVTWVVRTLARRLPTRCITTPRPLRTR